MKCPNKNHPDWKRLVETYGEDMALVMFQQEEIPKTKVPQIEQKIYEVLASDPEFYLSNYGPLVGRTNVSLELLANTLASRFDGLEPVIDGDVVHTLKGDMLLLPEVEMFKTKNITNSPLQSSLETLSRRYRVPFIVINDPKQLFKGQYLNQGEEKAAVINLAYATEDTPLHEVFHPFVRSFQQRFPEKFRELEQLAKVENPKQTDSEELVTDYLAKQARTNKITLYLRLFYEHIRKIFGLENRLGPLSTLKDVLITLDKGVDLSGERTLTRAFQKLDETEQLINKAFSDRVEPEVTNYLDLITASAIKYTTSDTSNFYQDESGNDVAKRLTSFIGDRLFGAFSVKFRRFSNTPEEWAAKNYFKQFGIDLGSKKADEITEVIKIGGREFSFKEVVESFQKDFGKRRIRGKLVHAYLQFLLETDSVKKAIAKQQALAYAKELGEPFNDTLETHKALRGIQDNLPQILEEAGILLDLDGLKGVPKNRQDKIAPELSLVSDLLVDADGNKLGSTIDGLIQHYNGEMSLIDYKTGDLTSDLSSPYLMEYGEKFGINDSKVSKAYLELAFRAMMLKHQYPKMRFRSIKVVRLDYFGRPTAMEVDLQPYLYTIGEYYKVNKPEIYEQLENLKLLDASSYKGVASSVVDLHHKISHLTRSEQLRYLQGKLASIHQGKTKAEIENDSQLSALSKQYTEAILELTKDAGVDLTAKTEDLGSLWGLKNMSDVDNPKVQTLHKLLLEAKDRTQKFLFENRKITDELYTKIVAEREGMGLSKTIQFLLGAANVYGVLTLSPLWFVGSILSYKFLSRRTNTKAKDHFAFMWRESTDPYKKGWYMNTQDTYLKNGVEVPLTQAEKDYRDHIRNTMKEEFRSFANEIVGYRFDNEAFPIYQYQLLGLDTPELPEDFMPRAPKPIEEIREEEDFTSNWLGLKTTVGQAVKRTLTNFLEDSYSKPDNKTPLRFFKHAGSTVVTEANHTWNVEVAFNFFMTSLKGKQNLDPIHDLAVGVSNALRSEVNEDQTAKYQNLVKFLDNQITIQLQSGNSPVKVSRNKIVRKISKLEEKLTNIPEGTPIEISQDRLLRLAKTMATYSVMSYKVISPIRNAALIAAQNITQSTRSKINKGVSYILGVPPESLDTVDLVGGRIATKEYIKAKLFGKEDESKLWNIAKRMDWLPDNYSYNVDNSNFLSTNMNLNASTNAFLLYQVGENIGALWQLAGLMKSIKVQNADGKESTLWDAHDDKGNWILGKRGFIENADKSLTELSELTAQEIKSLKRAYEKLNGSYRKEEKTALEATVFGDFIMQFHKYFYQYLKVLLATPYKDPTVGKYVLTGKRPEGMPVYQWHSEVMEGQLKILVGSIFAAMSRKGKKYLTESAYGENTIKGHRARALANLLNTFLWFMVLSLVFHLSLDDEEEESYVGRMIERTITDLSRGSTLSDLVDNMEKPIVAVDKMVEVSKALFSLMTEGIMGEEGKDGWPKGLKTVSRAIPGISGTLQIADVLANEREDNEYLFGLIPVKP